MKEMHWSRIREQNSVYKEFLEIVGNGKPTGSVLKETIAVSATISTSVEKLHHQIRLRILSCSRMSENHREPEVPEEKVPVVECIDGLARITSKELAITHFVKSGTLQNACSTRPRVVVGLGKKCSYAHRLVDEQPTKRSKKEWWQKCSSYIEERWLARKRICYRPMSRTTGGNLMRGVIRSWDKSHLNVDHLMHGNWVLCFKTWRRRSLFTGRAQTCRDQSSVWNSQRLLRVTLKFVTKILRSDFFAQGNLMSVAPTLQNLRIGLRGEN